MVDDIVPGLLEDIKKSFNDRYKGSKTIQAKLERLKSNNLNYEDAYDYAEEVGQILVDVFRQHITSETLPDEKMYYNIAKRLLDDTLTNNHELVADYSQIVQTALNHQAGYSIEGKKLKLNYDRINGFIQRLAREELFTDVDWILDEPVKTFTNATVDETVKLNAEFNNNLGITATIERAERYDACSWCRNLEGIYNYPEDVPEEVFQRHDNCRGRVIYRPTDKRKVQNVHTKQWSRR